MTVAVALYVIGRVRVEFFHHTNAGGFSPVAIGMQIVYTSCLPIILTASHTTFGMLESNKFNH
jgi:hypothetical protein